MYPNVNNGNDNISFELLHIVEDSIKTFFYKIWRQILFAFSDLKYLAACH